MDQSITSILQKSALGTGSTAAELAALVATMDVVRLADGQLLFEEGAEADAAYVLLQGVLDILGAGGTALDQDLPGALVGEQALVPGASGRRNATVRAAGTCRLLRLDAVTFGALLQSWADARRRIEADADAKTHNRLGKLSSAFRHLLAASEPRAWADGEAVFHEGDIADGLHLVLAGQAEVVAFRDGEPVHLSTVYSGQCFGELGSFDGGARTASVVARAGLRTAFVPLDRARAARAAHPELEAFLGSLVRSYSLPRRGTVEQHMVFQDGVPCIQTLYTLADDRRLAGVRTPQGRYTLTSPDADVHKTLVLAPGTAVALDREHRVVGLEDTGNYDDVSGLQALALDGTPLSAAQRRGLRQTARQAAQHTPTAIICRCLGLQRSVLEQAVDNGAHTLPALQDATGCGTVCGGCLKVVPSLLPAQPSPPDVTPPPAAQRAVVLPRVPRLIPWLGNFTFGQDPHGFQQRGHAGLGPVFGAHLMGADFVFVDAVARPELADLVRHDPTGALDRTGAYRVLAGRVWGDPVLDISTDLSVSALSPGTAEAVAKVVENAVGHGKAIDLVALATEVVVAGLVAHAGVPCDAAAVAAWVRDLEASYGVFDAMVPIATPAVRRRVAARDALVDALGVPLDSLMVASARNASMAVVASMLQLAQDPDAQAQHRADLSSCALDLAGLQAATGLHAVLADAVQNHGHGGVWRRACRATTIDGMPIPEGALVGLTDGRTVGVGEASVRGFDESFGLGLPELRLPEVLALLGLSVMLRAGSWSVRTAPRRWTPAFLPGMGWPVGPVRVAVDGG